MTIKEAIGVHECDIDIQTGEKLTYSEIYGRAIEYLGGLNEVAKFIPFPVNVLCEKLKEDPHLNNTSQSAWDKAAGFKCNTGTDTWRQDYQYMLVGGGIWELYEKHGVTSASCADRVCILKEAARMLVERAVRGLCPTKP